MKWGDKKITSEVIILFILLTFMAIASLIGIWAEVTGYKYPELPTHQEEPKKKGKRK